MWYAIDKGSEQSAEFLIDKGVDVNYRRSPNDYPALALLIYNGWLNLAQKVIDNKLPITKETVIVTLHVVAYQSNPKDVKEVTHFIDSLVKDVVEPGKTLTQYLGHDNITRILSSFVAYSSPGVFKHFVNTYSIDVKSSTDKEGNNPLHLVVTTANLDKTRFLLEEKGIPVNVVNKKLETPLHAVCNKLAFFDITDDRTPEKLEKLSTVIKYLISKGASLETRSSKRKTPIDLLIQGVELVKEQSTSRYLDHVIVGVRTIADILRYSIQQGKLSRKLLNTYASRINKVVMSNEVQKHRILQYELLTLPIRSLLPNFLKKRLTELCGEESR